MDRVRERLSVRLKLREILLADQVQQILTRGRPAKIEDTGNRAGI